MSASKNILVTSSSLILTDYLPAGEGLIAYNILDYLARSGNNITALAPQVRLKNANLNFQTVELGNFDFFPAPDEFNYLLRWRKYSKLANEYYKTVLNGYEFDVIHYMLPMNLNQSYSLILNKPLIVGPAFHPWIDLSEDEYSSTEIKERKDLIIVRKIKNFIKKRLKHSNKIKYHSTLSAADKIIVTLDCVRKFFPEEFQNKIVKIPIGVDTTYFTPAETLPDNNNVLFLAYLVKRKGLEYLIKAIEIIKRRIPDVKLNVVGDGPDKDFFIKLTSDLKLENNVVFAGNANHKDTVQYFRKSQIYVLPSLCEPFGMSVLEAMSCGLPVIATDAGGIPEVMGVKNKEYLTPPRDAEKLADKIIRLLLNYDKCREAGKDNREYAVRNYDWRLVSAKYNSLYDEICG